MDIWGIIAFIIFVGIFVGIWLVFSRKKKQDTNKHQENMQVHQDENEQDVNTDITWEEKIDSLESDIFDDE